MPYLWFHPSSRLTRRLFFFVCGNYKKALVIRIIEFSRSLIGFLFCMNSLEKKVLCFLHYLLPVSVMRLLASFHRMKICDIKWRIISDCNLGTRCQKTSNINASRPSKLLFSVLS